MTHFEVRRDDLHATRVVASERPEIGDGQALLAVDGFGLTANNVSYGVFGETMGYWDFFPAADGWGRVPVWGFADVSESAAAGLEAGTRVFGYLPPATYLLAQPAGVDAGGFTDAAPHRAHLPGAYNRYLRTDVDPFYDRRHEAHDMLLRPLFITSFLLDDELADGGLAGATMVVLSSASAKTAIGTAYLLARREGVEAVGLTSAGKVELLERLGVYDRVVPYDELEALDAGPSAFVDVSGDPRVRAAVHGSLADGLTASIALGATHWREFEAGPATELAGGGTGLPGPRPRFFFAPDRMAKRSADWGVAGLMERAGEASREFVAWAAGWLELERGSGLEAAERAWLELLDGSVPPWRAHAVSP